MYGFMKIDSNEPSCSRVACKSNDLYFSLLLISNLLLNRLNISFKCERFFSAQR